MPFAAVACDELYGRSFEFQRQMAAAIEHYANRQAWPEGRAHSDQTESARTVG